MFYDNINRLLEKYNSGLISKAAFIAQYERLVEDKANFRKEMYINEQF